MLVTMDRSSLDRDAVLLLAKELYQNEEDINTSMYNFWIAEVELLGSTLTA